MYESAQVCAHLSEEKSLHLFSLTLNGGSNQKGITIQQGCCRRDGIIRWVIRASL